MMTTAAKPLTSGAVIRWSELNWEDRGELLVAIPVNEEKGAALVKGLVVRIKPGGTWSSCEKGKAQEVVGVIWRGKGSARVGEATSSLEASSALYAPSGTDYEVKADQGEEITLYIWQTELPAGSLAASKPRLFNHLYNDETQLKGFTGNDPSQTITNPANMNFLFWPGTGSARLSLHCGIQEPGQSFAVHQHPHSSELFIGVEGKGEIHLNGEWHPFEAGDLLYVPQGIFHGTRNLYTGEGAARFVTTGGPTPFDASFYTFAGVSPEVVNPE
ncbi:cupin domain-containing protein [Paenibacillus pinisoli]|uniref:Cupin domain-containing protein n=1 Tax=Paenibacillus pinisoli TaxID=1276110 RepID=A0A3A6PT68_9BACL|nr:cupin domain-containing protein [Paenibacillus pinisoli]RJX39871.1 cupin domain-containing protein [Paenibacillus pinisoli]